MFGVPKQKGASIIRRLGDVKYVVKDYPGKLSQSLKKMQEQNQLCDITINVGGRAFHAHKTVLAACSSYFLAMFTSGFKESSESEIKIEGDAEIFKLLLEFAYTGELIISSKTACDVLDMACYMQFSNIAESCSGFIKFCYESQCDEDKIAIGDAVKIGMVAMNHEHIAGNLVEASEKYLQKNLEELKKSDAFLENASVDFLEEFLSHEDLSSASEEEHVLDAVLGWLKYDLGERRTHAHKLLHKVRLGHITAESLRKVDAEILEIPECKMLFDEVLQLKSSEIPKASLSRQYPELFATRSTIRVPVSSAVMGNGPYRRIYFQYYNAKEDCWIDFNGIASLPYITQSNSMLEVNGDLYTAGGLVANQNRMCSCGLMYICEHDLENEPDLDDSGHPDMDNDLEVCRGFYCYNLEENAWTELSEMSKYRRRFHMVHLDGFIYAISGTNTSGDIDYFEYLYDMADVERYNMASKEWEALSPLPVKVRHCAAQSCISAAAFKGKIIVYGAATVDESPKHVLLVYHPNTGRWQIALCEEHDEDLKNSFHYKPPALFVYQDICYCIQYPKAPEPLNESPNSALEIKLRRPVVNILEFKSHGDDDISVTIGPEIKQDHIPDDTLGAFRIHDEVFLDNGGLVYKTSIKIKPDQSRDVNLCKYKTYSEFYRADIEMSNNTFFTFDKKLLK